MRIIVPTLLLSFCSFLSLAQNYSNSFSIGEEVRLNRGRIWDKPTSQSKVLADEQDEPQGAIILGGLHDRILTIYNDTIINNYIQLVYRKDEKGDSVGWAYIKNLEKNPVVNYYSIAGLDTIYCLKYIKACEWKLYNDSTNYSRFTHSELYKQLGTIYYRNKNYFKSIVNYSKSIDLGASNYARVKRAFAKNELGDLTGSLSDLKIVTNTKSDTWVTTGFLSWTIEYSKIDVLNLKGYLELKTNKTTDALADLNRSISIESKGNPEAYYYRAFCYLNLNLKAKACLDFSKAGEHGMSDAYKAIQEHCSH